MRGLVAAGMTVLVLLGAGCTADTSSTPPQAMGNSTTAHSRDATDPVVPPALATGTMPSCGSRSGEPYFKAPLATGAPETYVAYGPTWSASPLCYSLVVSNPSAFPELQHCATVGRDLNGPLRLNSGQMIWLAGSNGLANSGPDPCYIPDG
jgi:hypothetical protein